MVLQESWLFEGTVHDNIAYGRPEATRAQVEEAARRARADAFIRALPQGYDTVLPEGGGSLSRGQRQLLCIARVMLTDPAVLLLDEATSSIDTRTELQVQAAFDELMRDRTSSWWRIASPRCATRTASWSCATGASSSAAATRSCSPRTVRTPRSTARNSPDSAGIRR